MGFLSRRYLFKQRSKRFVVWCFDLAGRILFFPLKLSRRPLDLKQIQHILVIRADHLGDVVMTKPALEALHRRFPHAAIDLLTSVDAAPLYEDAREIREVITWRHNWFSKKSSLREKLFESYALVSYLRARKYDLGIDFRGDLRHILLMFLAGVGHRLGYGMTGGHFLLQERPDYNHLNHQVQLNLALLKNLHVSQDNHLSPFSYSRDQKKNFWDRLGCFLGTTAKPRIVMHLGAGYPSKRWPGEKFLDLIQRIGDQELAEIVLIGTEEERLLLPNTEKIQGKIIDLRGQTSLKDLLILMDSCDLFVGNDSGPAHLAAAQGLESVVIFSGTNHADIWHPWTKRLHLIHHDVPCSPCESEHCPLRHHDCMEKISTAEVLAAIREIVENRDLTSPKHPYET